MYKLIVAGALSTLALVQSLRMQRPQRPLFQPRQQRLPPPLLRQPLLRHLPANPLQKPPKLPKKQPKRKNPKPKRNQLDFSFSQTSPAMRGFFLLKSG